MKTSIKLIIKDDYVKRDGTSALHLQVFVEKKQVRFPLELSWSVKHFDKKAGKIKPRTKEDTLYNDYTLIIQAKEAELNEIFVHYRLSKEDLTIEQLKKDYYNWKKRGDFYDFFAKEVLDRHRRKKIEYATYKCQMASLNKMKLFKPTCIYTELTPKLMENFRAWMKAKLGNRPATVEKTLKDIKTYINLAIRDKVSIDNPFLIVKVRSIEVIPEVMNLDQVAQLLALYEREDLLPAWRRVLQHFLFSCFTGLRISDIQRVGTQHIVDGALVFTAHKTRNSVSRTVSIPLHPIALRFVTVNAGKLFKTYSEQYINRTLRKIAEHLGWNIRPTTHTARHSFATNFIELGGDVVTLQGYLGHGKIQTTMKYVHISDRRKREQINVFDHFTK